MKVGIFLGRAIPSLHPGHLQLIDRILHENDKLAACIGSAQIKDPPIVERYRHWYSQLEILAGEKPFELYVLVDPVPIDSWPDDLVRTCGIKKEDRNIFYRADQLDSRYIKRLNELGIVVKKVNRKPFFWLAPDGLYYKLSSSTQIRQMIVRCEKRLR